ncbi:MAG: uroporphyrinogen decarboxylase family protein [Dorea sp.]
MKIEKSIIDQMTPVERINAIERGQPYDRIPCIPFIGNMRCLFLGVNEEEYWNSAEHMVNGEILAFNRFGFDRLGIGPNTRGISDALRIQFANNRSDGVVIDDYSKLDAMEPVDAFLNKELARFMHAAEVLQEKAGAIAPIEASIGGPFTIASFLRGIEILLRDCRRNPQEVHRLMRIVVDSQKSCVDKLAEYGVGIAMADPVANPALIGPKFYEKFVFPYTKELTDYIYERTHKKASLHMCGETYSIWKYLSQYSLNEVSLDNIVDLDRAANELGQYVPIAGNVDPVEIVMRGSREEIFEGVKSCIEKGTKAQKGYHLATGCDIPDGTAIEKVDWFMEAARMYGKNCD